MKIRFRWQGRAALHMADKNGDGLVQADEVIFLLSLLTANRSF